MRGIVVLPVIAARAAESFFGAKIPRPYRIPSSATFQAGRKTPCKDKHAELVAV